MTTTFLVEDAFPCSERRFWEVFFDGALNARLYRDDLAFSAFSIVEQSETSNGLRRVIDAVPELAASAPVRRLLGPTFRYREEGEFDRRTARYTYRLIPSTFASRLHYEGTVCVVERGRDVLRRAEVTLDTRLGPMSGAVESLMRRTTELGYRRYAAAVARYLGDGDGAGR